MPFLRRLRDKLRDRLHRISGLRHGHKCLLTGVPSSKYVVYATARAYRELYGKITDRKHSDRGASKEPTNPL